MQYRSDNSNHWQCHQLSALLLLFEKEGCESMPIYLSLMHWVFHPVPHLLVYLMHSLNKLIMRRNLDNDIMIATHTWGRQFINQSCIQLCDVWELLRMWVKYHFDAFIVHIITFVVLNQEHLQRTPTRKDLFITWTILQSVSSILLW